MSSAGGFGVTAALTSCSLLDLIQEANREHVAFHIVDDRLIVHPHRTRQDIVAALIDRGEEVADFLETNGRYGWRTSPAEEAYRDRVAADEMCVTMFSMPWEVCTSLVIAAFAEIVGEAWERYVARIPPVIEDPHPWHGESCASWGGVQ